jgi:alanine-synthesizing transaminase
MFSQRTSVCREPNQIARALQRAAQEGRSLIDLTLSNPTLARLPYDFGQLCTALSDPELIFYRPEPLGLRSARETVVNFLGQSGITGHPERTLLTASTSDAYSYLFKLLCEPGDRIVVPQPSYPLFEHLASLESVELEPYFLQYDHGWHINIDAVKNAVSSRTKAILVVSPNNPTGSYIKRDELAALSEIGLPIISDEVFSSYPLVEDPLRASSALQCDSVLVFSLFGLSKTAGLPQLKLSWVCVNGPAPHVAEACERLELIADTYLSVSTQVQLAASRLLDLGLPLQRAIRMRTAGNLSRLRSLLSATRSIGLLDVEGGWYVTLRLPDGQRDESVALRLVEEYGVSVYPGYFFDFAEENLLVVSLLVPEGEFIEGIQKVAACVRSA